MKCAAIASGGIRRSARPAARARPSRGSSARARSASRRAARPIAVLARSRDWAQVRPEWGLAGNAAFIAAPRKRTRGIDLDGRAFLHDYDWRADAEFAVLELIMTAPMVVASWINLQYFGSTVNNRVFGAGNKVLHNVTGTIGVLEGNAGDLKSGLPLAIGPRRHALRARTAAAERLHRGAPGGDRTASIAKHDAVRDLRRQSLGASVRDRRRRRGLASLSR